jgi:hypothetical protein
MLMDLLNNMPDNGPGWGGLLGSMGPSTMPQQTPWLAIAQIPGGANSPQASPWVNPDTPITGAASIPSIGTTPTAIGPGDSWLQKLKSLAAQAFPENPTAQQVALTQAVLESGNSPSKLAQQNNVFGIKQSPTVPGTGMPAMMPTNEFANGSMQSMPQQFATNNSLEDSFNQYKALMGNKRYAPVAQAQSPIEAFAALQKAGYATDPKYAQKLNSVYRTRIAPLYYAGGI